MLEHHSANVWRGDVHIVAPDQVVALGAIVLEGESESTYLRQGVSCDDFDDSKDSDTS